jgi:hypothetical protein
VDAAHRGLNRWGVLSCPQRFTTGSVYCFKYVPDRRSDFFRWMFLGKDRIKRFYFYKSAVDR